MIRAVPCRAIQTEDRRTADRRLSPGNPIPLPRVVRWINPDTILPAVQNASLAIGVIDHVFAESPAGAGGGDECPRRAVPRPRLGPGKEDANLTRRVVGHRRFDVRGW